LVERHAPAETNARQELRRAHAVGLVGRGRALVDAPSSLDERADVAHRRWRHVAARFDLERAVLRRQRDELASPIALVRLAEKPRRPGVALALLAVAGRRRDMLDLEVVADLEVRHRQR